jgi:ADP-ribosylglycohydrolase
MSEGGDMGFRGRETLNLLLKGLAAGDSLGSTSEFTAQARMPRLYETVRAQGWPYRQIGGGSFGWQPGQPTDDTEMALRMVQSYRRLGTFDGADVARRFVEWMQGPPPAPDIGGTTLEALTLVSQGTAWHEAGYALFRDNPGAAANGSLMRNGVVPGMANSLEDVFRITMLHGLITHYAPLCQLCCAAQSWLIWQFLQNQDPFAGDWRPLFEKEWGAWQAGTDHPMLNHWRTNTVFELPKAWDAFHGADFDPDSFNPYTTEIGGSAGYVLLTLQIAVWAAQWSLRGDPFEGAPACYPAEIFEKRGAHVLPWVVLIGHDADTYAATAGPLLAAAHGSIPDEYTDGLWILMDEMPDPESVRRMMGLR